METSPASKFRFRDHGNDMEENGESVVGDTSSESTSVTSDDEESEIGSEELASMTAKGINHLCLELIELKQASDVDFQDNIISNYSSFIRVFRETEGINNEVMQLKHHLMAQKQLVRNLMDGAYLKAAALDDPMDDTVLDESELNDQNPTTVFKTRSDEVLETLDNLLFEHRLEEALELFEMEDGDRPKVKFQEDVSSPDVWMCYKSNMAERRVVLADKLTMLADNTRVSAAELQKSLVGLSRLGFDHLATRLLLKYYHARIANNLQSTASSLTLPEISVHDTAKYVFSMVSQAARSFVVLHGENSPYISELMKWACEETEAFSACFNRHVRSISQISGGLSMAINSVHVALSYCSMLESQKLGLSSCLIENILPCMEGVLKAHFDRFKKVIGIFTASDMWVMGRYLVSGMLTKGSSLMVDQHPNYCLLTNSGRKFVSLIQAVIEDVSSLITIMGSSILEELVDLFTEYILILEKAVAYETDDAVEEGATRIKIAESVLEKVSVIANLSTLEHFFSSLIRNLFKDVNQLESVINDRMVSVASTCSSMRTHFCEQFIQSIMSNEASCIGEKVDSNLLHDPMPSLPYQVLFLELRKLEQLAEDNVAKYEWLVSLLTELVETTFDWVSINGENRTTLDNEDTTDQQSDRLTQFALDMQFLVEVARRGGYLTTNMINSSTDLVLQMESAIVSAGFDLNRYVIDHEKAANLAMEAIKELEAQEEHKSHSDDDIDQLDQEYLPHSSRDSIDDDDNDTQNSSEISFERDEKYTSTNTNYLDHGEDDLEKDSSIYTDSLEDEKDADFVENGLMEIKRGKLQKLSLSTNAESCAENVQPVTSEIEQVGLTTSDELLQLRKIRRVSKVVKEQVL